MSENTEDLGLDEILDDVEEGSEEDRFYSENEAGEVMFDPNRVVSDEEAAATLAASSEPELAETADDVPVPDQVGEVKQMRLDPEAQPMTNVERLRRREERKAATREKQIAADKQLRKDARKAQGGDEDE